MALLINVNKFIIELNLTPALFINLLLFIMLNSTSNDVIPELFLESGVKNLWWNKLFWWLNLTLDS